MTASFCNVHIAPTPQSRPRSRQRLAVTVTVTVTVTMAALPSSLFRWVVPAAIGASVIQSSIYDVKGGTRAVIFDRVSGVKEQVVNEGTHFLVPWLQRAIVYDVRTRPRNISTTTGSKDLQMVTLTLRVLHRPEVKQLPKIYQVRGGHRPVHCDAEHEAAREGQLC
jgi:regulator of protease activity HflC (stomatin/prohibitin superfamily)